MSSWVTLSSKSCAKVNECQGTESKKLKIDSDRSSKALLFRIFARTNIIFRKFAFAIETMICMLCEDVVRCQSVVNSHRYVIEGGLRESRISIVPSMNQMSRTG